MNITILDGNALNPGDLSWEGFFSLGNVTVYPRTEAEALSERMAESDAILINKIQITKDLLNTCPSLKYIGVQATGYNNVDIEECRKRGITVTNVPSYSSASVAQMVFTYITQWASLSQLHSQSVMEGDWIKSKDFCYWKKTPVELEGKILGIFGYGNIGQKVEQIAKAFGMKILVCTKNPEKHNIKNPSDFEKLLKESDFLTFHVPLTESTQGIINYENISKMKKSAYIINTARGGLAKEDEVKKALEEGLIAGYATDTLIKEPMEPSCPLYKAPNCIITPHIAWAAKETRKRCLEIAVKNLEAFIKGQPQNVVS